MTLPTTQLPRSRVFLWIAVGLGAAVLSLYAFTAFSVFQLGSLARDAGWTAKRTDGRWYVRDVKGSAASGLRAGDLILAIDGDTRFATIDPNLKLLFLSPGQDYSVRVQRGPGQVEIPLSFSHQPGSNIAWVGSLMIAGLMFCAVGILLGTLWPGNSLTRLGCLSSMVTAVHISALVLRSVQGVLPESGRIVLAVASSAAPWHLAIGYHFFSRFPSAVPESRVWIGIRWLIYLYCAVVSLPRAILTFVALGGQDFAVSFHAANAGWIAAYQDNVLVLESALKIGAALAICFVLVRNYRMLAESPDQRRRVKWVAAAAGVGMILPAFAALLLLALRGTSIPSSGSYPLNIIVTNLASALIPITLAYAVLKHRVFGMDVVIRRGLQYLLAKNTLRILLFLPVLAVVFEFVSNQDRTVKDTLAGSSPYVTGIILVAGAVSLKYRRQLSLWVDRKFFREAYDRESMLLDLIDEIKNAESIPEISSMVGTRIQLALHPASLHILSRRSESDDLLALFSSSESQLEIGTVAATDLESAVGDSQKAIQVIPGQSMKSAPAWRLIEEAGTRLIVPVRDSKQHLTGLILLGEKKSEEPYTSSDRTLLQAIGTQLGIAFDLVAMKERVDREQKLRENAIALMQHDQMSFLQECPECGVCFDSGIEVCPNDNARLVRPLLIERLIGAKYRLDQRIGKGGYGAVYEAWDLHLKRRVALKVVAGAALTHASAMRRFEREARAAARLNHPNIISIYDFGAVRPEGAYLAMELIRGATWRSELRRLGAIPPALAADWLDQLFEGISAAHKEGVVHRDLKPENVLIAFEENGVGVIKILDFGLAKLRLLDLNDPDSFTIAGSIVGTLGYMSPEQFTGGQVDERSDIFSLGIMVVEALTGRRPFHGRTPAALLKSVLHDPVQLKTEGRGGHDLNRVLHRCLAKDPVKRYRTVYEMRRDLIPLVRACGAVALQPGGTEAARTMTIGN